MDLQSLRLSSSKIKREIHQIRLISKFTSLSNISITSWWFNMSLISLPVKKLTVTNNYSCIKKMTHTVISEFGQGIIFLIILYLMRSWCHTYPGLGDSSCFPAGSEPPVSFGGSANEPPSSGRSGKRNLNTNTHNYSWKRHLKQTLLSVWLWHLPDELEDAAEIGRDLIDGLGQ